MIDARLVSVIIPARNEAAAIAEVVRAVRGQRGSFSAIEVIVVDDGSTDDTVASARSAGARVIEMHSGPASGNPAAARNRGAAAATGDPLVFLDSDCLPLDNWLEPLVAAHRDGAAVAGGALDIPPGLPWTARVDYYAGWYLVHSGCPAGPVRHHPPPSLSVRRELFRRTSGFVETPPLFYTNEERLWQSELRKAGHSIVFEPSSVALHHNRPGFRNLLARSYRWGYTALEAKSETGSTRAEWVFSRPYLVLAMIPLLPFLLTIHAVAAWARVGRLEPLVMAPVLLVSRVAYVAGMTVGGLRWLRARRKGGSAVRPAPKWQ